jgi:hypothetical protein
LIGDWQRRAPFPLNISHASTFVIGNKGYVVGGTNGGRTLFRDVYEFDHTAANGNGTWTSLGKTPLEMIPRQQAVGFSLRHSNGKYYGYIGTGYGWIGEGKDADWATLKDFWQYDKDNNSWEQVAPLPDDYQGVEAKPRRGAIAFSLEDKNGKWYGYVGCGYTEDENGIKHHPTDFWQFDPEGTTPKLGGGEWTGRWTPVLGYGGGKRYGASVFVIDNKAYICNGESLTSGTNANDFWRFDPNAPETERWIGSPKGLRTMADVNKDEDYDDDYGTLARSFGVAYVVNVNQAIEGAVQLRGHIVGGNKNSSYNWEYNHRDDLWVQRTSLINNQSKSPREGLIAFSFPEAGKAFVGLGKANSAYYDDIWEFIPMIDDDAYSDYY